MHNRSLSSLYRRLVSLRPRADFDAAELCALASGEHLADGRREAVAMELAGSPPHADLARMLRVLRPQSQALAGDMRQIRRAGAHPLRGRETRPATAAHRGHVRRLRWAGALAASLVVALGAWSWHHEDSARHQFASVARSAPLPDRIFTTHDVIFAASGDMHGRHAQRSRGDQLFRGSFSAGG
ncbi:MAG: hypothetical protein ACHP7D_07755 [Lysobacterales bacterium]